MTAGFIHADDEEFENISPSFYLKIKNASKMSLTRDSKSTVILDYYSYDKDTGELLKQPKIALSVAYYQALRSSIAKQLSDVDELLADISKL
jgi:hypothetical protein